MLALREGLYSEISKLSRIGRSDEEIPEGF